MDDDRLSELPDSLILSILSLLNMKDVVMTTLLSKRWKNRWTTVPCLDFGIPFYGNKWVKYSKFVSGALAQWKGAKIMEFDISFSRVSLSPSSSDIDSWLLFATEKQVEKLTVDPGSAYLAPQCLYSCSSVTKLSLYTCSLMKIERNVQWNKLKRLKIGNPYGLSGDAMNQILVGAPLLEELVLLSFEISENFNIRSTSLKMLEIAEYGWSILTLVMEGAELRIWAPNLLSLVISGIVCGSCLLYVPSLTAATLSFKDSYDRFITVDDMPPLETFHQVFHSIRDVVNVSLSEWSFQFLVEMKESDMPLQFPNAEFLKLLVCEDDQMLDVRVILEMFPKLKMLIVDQCFQNGGYLPNKVASEMISGSPSLPHLTTVEIIYGSYPSISPLVKFLLKNAHKLQKMVLQPDEDEYNQEAFILALKELLGMRRSSPYAELIISDVNLGQRAPICVSPIYL